MSDKTGAVIVKPCHQSEIDFYETTALHPQFREYIPEYIGTLAINPDAAKPAATPFPRPVHGHSLSQSALLEPVGSAPVAATVPEAWTPSGGRKLDAERGVVLENVAYGFTQPNILDVKLGARLWADDAPLAKRQKLDKVASETTSGSMCFRIAGMKTWQGPDAGPEYEALKGYLRRDKFYGRSFTPATVDQGFQQYFFLDRPNTPRNRMRKIVKRFIEDLRGLVEVLEAEESRMYSASLLFVYEGDGGALAEKFKVERVMMEEGGLPRGGEQDASEAAPASEIPDWVRPNGNTLPTPDMIRVVSPSGGSEEPESDVESEPRLPRIQVLKMIDFAHASWTPGYGPDENVLRGIRNVIEVLERLLN
jgi:inositol-polyphosphate multikinase